MYLNLDKNQHSKFIGILLSYYDKKDWELYFSFWFFSISIGCREY